MFYLVAMAAALLAGLAHYAQSNNMHLTTTTHETLNAAKIEMHPFLHSACNVSIFVLDGYHPFAGHWFRDHHAFGKHPMEVWQHPLKSN